MLQYFGDDLLLPPPYITGESSLQAHWCTLLAGCAFSPIKRLTPSQISEFEKKFTPVLHGEAASDSLSKAPYYSMPERMLEDWIFAMTTNGSYLMIQS
ncbi:hypothetical protein B0O99DRAFT_639892 [Bisporella sp. PMI_857]|nr:hypothetical protein B0O99DRAFT_639892 [Bisporella sp. PMI_857]